MHGEMAQSHDNRGRGLQSHDIGRVAPYSHMTLEGEGPTSSRAAISCVIFLPAEVESS